MKKDRRRKILRGLLVCAAVTLGGIGLLCLASIALCVALVYLASF